MKKICEEKILSIQEYSICQRVIFKINFLLKKTGMQPAKVLPLVYPLTNMTW